MLSSSVRATAAQQKGLAHAAPSTHPRWGNLALTTYGGKNLTLTTYGGENLTLTTYGGENLTLTTYGGENFDGL